MIRYTALLIATLCTEYTLVTFLNFMASDGSFGSGISDAGKVAAGFLIGIGIYLGYATFTVPQEVEPTYKIGEDT